MYRDTHKEEIAARSKVYQEAHKEEIATYRKSYDESNKEEIAARRKVHRDTHKEEIAARKKVYRDTHKEVIAAGNKAWHAKNRTTIAAKSKVYREENKEVLTEKKKEHYEANKSDYMARAAKRRAAKLERTPSWCDAIMEREIADLFALAIEVELETGVKQSLEHIIPMQGKKVSGLDVLTNLTIMPLKENLSKGNRYDEDTNWVLSGEDSNGHRHMYAV